MIYRTTVEYTARNEWYTVRTHELQTAAALRETANSLWDDEMHQESNWYLARARETGNSTYWDFVSTFGGYYPETDRRLDTALRKRNMSMSALAAAARKKPGQPVYFYHINY